MSHHQSGESCALCEEKLKQAHPILVEWFRSLKKTRPDAHVSWAYRDEETQNFFFKEGKTRVRFPDSKHNVIPAEALDIFERMENGVARWRRAYFEEIAKSLDPSSGIGWGGDWKTLKDADHFYVKGLA